MTMHLLRLGAIAIALAALWDPSVTTTRGADRIVAVVPASEEADAELAEAAARRLERRFTVVRGPFPGADATVIAGATLPASAPGLAPPVFVLLPEPARPDVRLQEVRAPARAPLLSRVPVTASLRVLGGEGRTLEVTLLAGDAPVDRAQVEVTSGDERVRAALSAVPTGPGGQLLRVEARLGDEGTRPSGAPAAASDLLVEIDEEDARWPVLFYDGRPSWMSTFVRRVLEQDPRFEVSSRVVTSVEITTAFGRPPATLLDEEALEGFAAVVVGAPDALGAPEVEALEGYLRRRGGTVLFLLDRAAPGPWEGLARAEGWTWREAAGPVALRADRAAWTPRDAADEAEEAAPLPLLLASELASPASLPPGARVLAASGGDGGQAVPREGGPAPPIVWQAPVGAGRLVVSGALDAWHHRDPETSGFEAFWRELLAEAAAGAPPPLQVHVGRSGGLARPGESVPVRVEVRAAALAPLFPGDAVHAEASARLAGTGESIRLWPAGPVGSFRGGLLAPEEPGSYRIVVSSGPHRVEVPLVVAAPPAPRPAADDADLLAAWAASRGGGALPASDAGELAAAIDRAAPAERRPERRHPMRSAWWIVPFVLGLGAEWWWRRKRGLP